jgi:hypothetical protein
LRERSRGARDWKMPQEWLREEALMRTLYATIYFRDPNCPGKRELYFIPK